MAPIVRRSRFFIRSPVMCFKIYFEVKVVNWIKRLVVSEKMAKLMKYLRKVKYYQSYTPLKRANMNF